MPSPLDHSEYVNGVAVVFETAFPLNNEDCVEYHQCTVCICYESEKKHAHTRHNEGREDSLCVFFCSVPIDLFSNGLGIAE